MCKKHEWRWLYLPTPDTDKIGWFVANLTPGGGLSPKDDTVCIKCGTIGWRRKSRHGNIAVYSADIQARKALEALELCQRVGLTFPSVENGFGATL